MKEPVHIHIPEPCHEDWQQMTATQKGKFCQSCSKEVVDFSYHSDDFIYRYLQGKDNVCGRFQNDQLKRPIIPFPEPQNNLKQRITTAMLTAFTLFGLKTYAQTPSLEKEATHTLQTDTHTAIDKDSSKPEGYRSLGIGKHVQQDSITVSGTITDEEKIPLPGATIVIKGTTIGTTTDFDGHFSIKAKAGDVAQVKYIGYEDSEFTIATSNPKVEVELAFDEMLTGEVVILGMISPVEITPTFKQDYYMKQVFSPEEEEAIEKRKQRTKNYFAFMKRKNKEERAKRKAARQARRNKK